MGQRRLVRFLPTSRQTGAEKLGMDPANTDSSAASYKAQKVLLAGSYGLA
jgi:hypothetical protein